MFLLSILFLLFSMFAADADSSTVSDSTIVSAVDEKLTNLQQQSTAPVLMNVDSAMIVVMPQDFKQIEPNGIHQEMTAEIDPQIVIPVTPLPKTPIPQLLKK